jgi:Cytochrome c
MNIRATFSLLVVPLCAAIFNSCNQGASSANVEAQDSVSTKFGGFSSQIAYGRHLVEVTGCGDCHTPKKMTAMGPVPDTTRALSGHPASMPAPVIDRKEAESKGLAITNDMTAWIGPWGISYAANLTPDETGIGHWSEAQFILAIREGKSKGMQGARPLLPPMPWQNFTLMKDDELKAVFAYLKSVKPIDNVVPPTVPPVSSQH